MTTLIVESSTPRLTVTGGRPNLTVSSAPVVLDVVAEDEVNLSIVSRPIELTVAPEDAVNLSVCSQPIVLVVSAGGGSAPGPSVNDTLVGLRWGSPSGEFGDAIEITGSILAYDGSVLVTSLPSLEIVVSDGAADAEPSHTAFLTASGSPTGTILAGSGTATMIIQAANGQIAISVHESTPNCHRYLWISGARHERLWVRALDGVQELTFA